MAKKSPLESWRLSLPDSLHARLMRHLFPGDHDEHGAIILAGVCNSDRGLRLVARELHVAVDGIDYVPGRYGYRMMKAEFIRHQIVRARDLRLAYLAVHNHAGGDSVCFSSDDLKSHARGYPALLDISRGMPVGALVFAKLAVAGDLWFPNNKRAELRSTEVIGDSRKYLFPNPRSSAKRIPQYDRQSRLFGDNGQQILGAAKIGIIGLGGAGSILAELLGRLGVGEFVLADPDKAETSNLPRLVGAQSIDAGEYAWLPRSLGKRLRRFKVDIAARSISRANPTAKITAIRKDFTYSDVARRFTDCDYLFLAADTMRARLLFNAIIHQYGVPGIQVGSKIPVEPNGDVGNTFCVSRPVTPGAHCLFCNGLISAGRLQAEAIPATARRGYAYIDDADVPAPSVITLNAIACAHAADEFLFHMTGMKDCSTEKGWFRWNSRSARASLDIPRQDQFCTECSLSDHSRLGRGDEVPLPVRVG